MSGVGHTPGPWRLDGGVVRGRNAHHERPIAEIYRELRSSDETLANARLIAAAPDLYAAALAAKDLLIDDLHEPGRTVFWKLVDALKKAGWSAEAALAAATPPSGSDARVDGGA